MATVLNKADPTYIDPHIPSSCESLGSATDTFSVVPSDTVDFPRIASSIWVGTGGTVPVVKTDGSVQLYKVPDGTRINVRAKRVNSTGLVTAADMVGER